MKNDFEKAQSARFGAGLLLWNRKKNTRQMPWKGEKDPYRIWLSEVILQQTRVEQGLKYYENFITAFPTIGALAGAPDEKVFKLWEGLGYYSRCRNLLTTARLIAQEYNGVFPSDYDSILALKGIGPYTAAAIASFAYNLPHAVLDGNVFRVLSRIFADDTPIDTTAGKKRFTHLAEEALAREEAGTYNQAIMDFGATVCKPVPDCASCFFSDHCEAFIQGKQQLLPVKEKKLKKRDRWLNYIVAYRGDEFLIRQRLEKDIWQQLFEFVLIETPSAVTEDELLTLFRRQYGVGEGAVKGFVHGTRQQLSHQQVTFTFLLLELGHKPPIEHHSWISRGKMETLAFPKTLKSFIQEHL